MRETAKTLRLYFGLSGAYGMFVGIRALSVAETVGAIVGLSFGAAYLYLAITLPKLLRDSLGTIKWVLVAADVCLGIALLSGLLLGNVFLAAVCVLGLAINWYLFRNAKRLAAELQNHPLTAQIPS
jgi:hypothetical protein